MGVFGSLLKGVRPLPVARGANHSTGTERSKHPGGMSRHEKSRTHAARLSGRQTPTAWTIANSVMMIAEATHQAQRASMT